jgi:hypothetical protein
MIAAEWRQPREALFHGSVVSEVSRCPPASSSGPSGSWPSGELPVVMTCA